MQELNIGIDVKNSILKAILTMREYNFFDFCRLFHEFF